MSSVKGVALLVLSVCCCGNLTSAPVPSAVQAVDPQLIFADGFEDPPPLNESPQVDAGADQTITLPASASLLGSASDDGLPAPPGSLTIAWSKFSGPGSVAFGNPAAATTSATFSVDGVYVLRLTASDGALATFDDVQISVNPVGTPPVLVPSAIDPTLATSVFASTEFLYTGPNPVQTGVTPGTIRGQHASVIRGRVLDRDGAPLSGVTVKVHERSEFGQTITREDGWFDLAVNGGESLTIDYQKENRLPVQRTLYVAWREIANAPDVVMIGLDPAMTPIAANAPEMQMHQGTLQIDDDGERQATLLFPAGTGATLVMPDGSTQPLASLDVRATEYTVGSTGPAAMPGVLPPTSAYTYAVELSVDQALAAGAAGVEFSQPVPVYVDNFLDFPAGTIVPAGYYDRERSAWVPMPNGIVVKVVSVTLDAADLDITGDDVPDDPDTELAPFGITLAERQQLATLFAAGQSFWRTPAEHFSAVDFNWPYAPPAGAKGAGTDGASTEQSLDECLDEASGSIIECQNQILGQSLPVVGTPYTLNYRSDRVPGREIARTIEVAASGSSIPLSLKHIELSLSVAGQEYTQTLPATANQQVTLVWDGKDAYGRAVHGRQSFTGSLDFVYDGVYTQPGVALGAAFAQFGDTPITSDPARIEFRFPQPLAGRIGIMDARGTGVGGWTLSAHHVYDPEGETLYLGNGKRLSAGPIPYILERIAGLGEDEHVSGVPGNSVELKESTFITVAPDGSVYFSETDNHRIRRIDPDGIITTVAGSLTGEQGFSGDGGPATQALLHRPAGLAFGPDGSLYFVDRGQNNRIRRIDPAGVITTVAGNGLEAFSGDGGPALQAAFRLNSFPAGLAVGTDGSIVVFDSGNSRIRRIGTDGIVNTIAGGGTCCELPNGIPATDGWLFGVPGGLAFDRDGTLYVGLFRNILRIGVDGIATVIAGTTNTNQLGDGGPAVNALLGRPYQVTIGPDGALYFVDGEYSFSNTRVRRISKAGIISTVAGGGSEFQFGDDPAITVMPAKLVELSSSVFGVTMASDGNFYIVDDDRILRARPPLPDFTAAPINVASEDGAQLYQFDLSGRHLRTRHALTGEILFEFGYDPAGRLIEIVEKTGGTDKVTEIQRDVNGVPTAIVAPYGQVTELDVDANGFVDRIENPANEAYVATFTAGGLMETFTRPGNRTSAYQYETDGRLKRADDALDGFQTIERAELANGHEITRTTALDVATAYRVENLPIGTQRLTTIAPDATQWVTDLDGAGVQVETAANGSVITRGSLPDPRFGMQAPFASSTSVTMPSALVLQVEATRTAVLADPANILSLLSQNETSSENGRTATSAYTAASRATLITSPVGRKLSRVTDAFGRITSLKLGDLAAITYDYDSRGRLESMTQGVGIDVRTYNFAYDPEGFSQTIEDPIGRTVEFTRDDAGRMTVKTLPNGAAIGISHNGAGDIASLTPPGKPAHAFTYNARGDVTQVTPPAVTGGGPTTVAYNPDGQVTQIARAGGESVTYTYDAGGRPSGQTLVNVGLPPAEYEISYDAAGRTASLAGPGAQTVALSYDGFLITGLSWTGPVNAGFTRTFDANLRVTSETVSGGSMVNFAYDDDNLLIQAGGMTLGRSAQTGLVGSTTLGVLTDSYSRNAFGEVAGYAALANGLPLFEVSFTRDAIGQIIEKQETIDGLTVTYEYDYDPLGQLTTVTVNGNVVEQYTYDANGNRTEATVNGVNRTATHDEQDRLVSDGAASFTFTPAGRLAAKTVGADTTTYGYDALGNLLTVTLPSGTVIDYQVDAMDRRIGKDVGGVPDQRFIHNGLNTIAELDSIGNVVSQFVFAAGGAPDYMIKAGATYRYITDLNGSVRLVVNAATAAVAQRLDYDAFGNVLLDTNPGFQPFGFAAGLYDADTGLVRFGARDYDPWTGRWTNKDPVGFAAGDANLYRYVRNNPVMWSDPAGTNKGYDPSDLTAAEWAFDDITDVFETDVVDNRLTPRQVESLYHKTNMADHIGFIRKKLGEAAAVARRARAYAGGLLSICTTALGALDVASTISEAYENDRSLLEQLDHEEQQLIESGVTQTLSCLGPVCMVNDLTQY